MPAVLSHRVNWISLVLLLVGMTAGGRAEDAPVFFRGLNLNGAAVVIDGNSWEGSESKQYECRDKAFENQQVPLVPPTDAARATMIRSSRWGGNEVILTDVPRGKYSVYLYVWEDNDPETFEIGLNGRTVVKQHNSGTAGHWDKLGPWIANVTEGRIRLTSRGGAANFSGIEVWRGVLAPDATPAANPEDLAFFEHRIRPVLVANCYECHSSRAKKIGGELLLDSRAGWQTGGESGPPITPGDPAKSLLIKALQHDGLQMPPEKKLSDEIVGNFARWIERGAVDPRDGSEQLAMKRENLLAEAKQRWAFTPPSDPAPPVVQRIEWPRNKIDNFILHSLEAAGLTPTKDADKRVLIRRATFDLIGLPPTPEEVDAFVADENPDSFQKVIERLLESTSYGERWGRYWLDVVRYSDTAGDNSDFPIPQMYLYRNWVIDAFNRDLRFDQFVREQLAGDLLAATSEEDRRQKIIATGYIANARRFGSRVDDYPHHLTIEDTIDNLGRAFQGLTLNCARCHDHKFDPISTEDYYGLYGIFRSTRYPWPGIELEQKQRDLVPLTSAEEAQQAIAKHKARQQELDAEVQRLEKERDQASGPQKETLKKSAEAARKVADRHSKSPLAIPLAYAMAESGQIENANVQFKGDPAKLGTVVPRGFPTALGGKSLALDDETSGRLSLADWITDPRNPLTARVAVNRLWGHHFGRGIVATPNDFGRQGKPPTHPELLDWLAHRFVESGWSTKDMHRLMMCSRTYQLAAINDPAAIPGDPANDLLSGFRPRRLDAEAIRDSLLALSGNLDRSRGGPHPFPPSTEWNFTQHNPFKAVYPTNQRTVYLMTQRIQRHPFLAIFDGPDPSASTPLRMTSTTPLQGLFLLNDPFTHQQAEKLADRLRNERQDESERIVRAYSLMLARPPKDFEKTSSHEFLAKVSRLLRDAGTATDRVEVLAWQSYVRSLLLLNEFVYID